MAVIINELEVVLESPAAKPGGTAPAAPAPPAGQHLQPIDVEDILQREARAAYRMLAH